MPFLIVLFDSIFKTEIILPGLICFLLYHFLLGFQSRIIKMDDFNSTECSRSNIIEDWETREFVQKITDLITNFTNQLNRIDIVWQTKINLLNEKLRMVEKQIQLLENQIYSNIHFKKMVLEYDQQDFNDDFE